MIRKSLAFVSNRFVSVLLLGTLVLLGVSEYKQWQERQKVSRQIDSLRAEAAVVTDKNSQLESTLKYLSSTSAAERLARQQNMKKAGEIAVVFVPDKDTKMEVAEASKGSNIIAWWTYFFNKK